MPENNDRSITPDTVRVSLDSMESRLKKIERFMDLVDGEDIDFGYIAYSSYQKSKGSNGSLWIFMPPEEQHYWSECATGIIAALVSDAISMRRNLKGPR